MIVVVVNYRSADYTRTCIESLTGSDCEFVIFDNASPAGDQLTLADIARDDPSVRLLRSEVNLGFGAGFNAAMQQIECADDDVVWLVNPDTRATPGALDALLDELEVHGGNLVLLSPVVAQGDSGTIWYAHGALDVRRGAVRHLGMGESIESVHGAAFDVDFMTGVAMLASAQTWRALGGFREDLFLYWEDVELSMRVRQHGGRLRVVPTSIIEHDEGGSSRRRDDRGKSDVFYFYFARNRLLVCAYGFAGRLDLLLGRGLIVTTKHVATLLLHERARSLGKIASYVRGCAHGLRGSTGKDTRPTSMPWSQ